MCVIHACQGSSHEGAWTQQQEAYNDDMLFTVETVSCLGACGLAPTLTVNDEVHPKMTPEKAIDLLNELRGETV